MLTTGVGLGNGVGLIGGVYGGGGGLVNSHSLEVNGFRFSNDFLSVESNPASFSVSAWVYLPSGAGTVLLFSQTILPNIASSGYIRLSVGAGVFYFDAFTNEDPDPPGGQTLWRDRVTSGATDYRDDSWHHVVVAMNGYGDAPETQMKMWVDGVDVSTVTISEGDTIRPTVWSMEPTATGIGNTSIVAGAKMAQLAYFDYYLSGVTLWNGGAVFDLNSLPTGPVEWYNFAENIDNSGSSGVDGTPSAGTASYSTDTPPE